MKDEKGQKVKDILCYESDWPSWKFMVMVNLLKFEYGVEIRVSTYY